MVVIPESVVHRLAETVLPVEADSLLQSLLRLQRHSRRIGLVILVKVGANSQRNCHKRDDDQGVAVSEHGQIIATQRNVSFV